MHRNDEQKHGGKSFAVNMLVGMGIGFLISIVLLALISLCISSGRASEDFIDIYLCASALCGALGGAFLSGRLHRHKIMLLALAVGILMFTVSLFGGILSNGSSSRMVLIPLLIVYILGSILGGLINLRPRKSRHTR